MSADPLSLHNALAAVRWALAQLAVTRVEAETEPDNRASQRVLEKCGFLPSGTIGEEGPRFYREQQERKETMRKDLRFITLRDEPEWKDAAAEWFHGKWGVPKEAYLACMDDYLEGRTEYGWYLCLNGDRIVGGMGVIENDFHDRKDLSPNVCAVYTEESWRGRGIAGRLLDLTVQDLREKGITPVYLVTDHIGFYERYGWEFFCLAQGEGEPEPTRLYIHR